MIQTAHIGIGLLGKEGNQAASFADYSIAEFRSLRKLILWHGRQFGQGSGDFLCTCVFKNVALSMSLSTYNFFAGFSGLQAIDSIFWLQYNLVITTIIMMVTFVMDQDVPMAHAANMVDNNTGKPDSLPTKDNSKEIYEEECKKLGFNISDYYLFAKKSYQLPLVYRTLLWELLAFCSGITCFFIPFKIYGYGVSNSFAKTEDLFTIYFASYQANVLTHHLQIFLTIRNYTRFVAIASCLSFLMLWPLTIVMANYNVFPSENLNHHLGEILFDQFFYQLSSMVLSTFIIVMPIYAFKVFKMRVFYPQFFPLNQSTL